MGGARQNLSGIGAFVASCKVSSHHGSLGANKKVGPSQSWSHLFEGVGISTVGYLGLLGFSVGWLIRVPGLRMAQGAAV